MVTSMRSILYITILTLSLGMGCTPNPPPTDTPAPSQTSTPVPTGTHTPTPTQWIETIPAPGNDTAISSLDMFPDGGWGVDEARGLLFRTVDGGETWTEISLPGGSQNGIAGRAFLDANTAWVVKGQTVSEGQVLLHTADAGQTWNTIQFTGLQNMPSPLFLKFISPTQGWVEQYEGGAGNLYIQVYGTDDGGATFQTVPIVPPDSESNLPEGMIHLCNICSDSFYYDPSRIVIVKGDMGSMEPGGAVHAQTSFDLGQTWNELSLPLPAQYQDALAWPLDVSFVSENDGFLSVRLVKYAAGGGSQYSVLAVYATHDGGITWQPTSGVPEQLPTFPGLQFVNAQDAVVLCQTAICLTHDGAQSWQAMPLDDSILPNDSRSIQQLDFIDSSTGWIIIRETMADATVFHIYKTSDGGATWNPQ